MAKHLDYGFVVMVRTTLMNAVPLMGALLLVGSTVGASGQVPIQTPSFKSGVDLVRLSAIVRDASGHFVTDLSVNDFEVVDGGQVRRITDFQQDRPGVSLAVLIDVSGSMVDRLPNARQAAADLLGSLDRVDDEAGVFTFDTRLNEVAPFTVGLQTLPDRLADVRPFGATSLHDAIAGTARRLSDRGSLRRAIIVFTDGAENWSELTSAQASEAASAIDVPVYIVGIVPMLQDVAPGTMAALERSMISAAMSDLASWTGGRSFTANTASDRLAVADQILEELRHQYLIAFEADNKPGWHAVVVRTRKKELVVRARNGYNAGQSRPIS
jgi:VWFA-related protein